MTIRFVWSLSLSLFDEGIEIHDEARDRVVIESELPLEYDE